MAAGYRSLEWKCFDADTGKDSAREIREYVIPDFSDWKHHDHYQKAFDQLLKDLKSGDHTQTCPVPRSKFAFSNGDLLDSRSSEIRMEGTMDRSQLTSNCPGSLAAAIVIAVGDAARFGVGNPANIGTCPLSIGGLDANGNLIPGGGGNGPSNLVLNPGDSVPWFTPPAGTVQLVFTCFSNCNGGQAILEFDTPIC
jgi:hypothetical protein